MSQLKDVFNTDSAGLNTFLGLPKCDDLSQLEAAVAIIGTPIATPYPGFGLFSASAPAALREAISYYSPTISHHDFEIDGSLLDDNFWSDC